MYTQYTGAREELKMTLLPGVTFDVLHLVDAGAVRRLVVVPVQPGRHVEVLTEQVQGPALAVRTPSDDTL